MIKPINDYILVEITNNLTNNLTNPNDKTPQKVKVLADYTVSTNESMAQVIADWVAMVQPGTYIYIQKYATADGIFDMDGKKVALIKFQEIMGVVDDKQAK